MTYQNLVKSDELRQHRTIDNSRRDSSATHLWYRCRRHIHLAVA